MSAFLFDIELKPLSERFVQTIPRHREHINKLFSEGRIYSYSVSAMRDRIWCVVNAEDEQEAMEIVSGFPLRRFFNDVLCHALLFHNTVPSIPNVISLN